MARTRTLTEMIAEVRQRADMVNSTFVTDDEITRWINLGVAKLYDILVKARGVDYYLRSYETTTSSTEPTVFLPHNFYKLVGIDAQYDGYWHAVEKMPFQSERNIYQSSGPWYRAGFPYKYNFFGGTRIEFYPEPTGSFPVRIWYIPHAPVLTNGTAQSLTVTYTSGIDYIIADSALNATKFYPDMQTSALTGNPYVLDIRGTTVYLSTTPSLTGSGALDFTQPRWNGINGWEEYVVLDASIVAMAKEEGDPSVLMAQKSDIERRIMDMADSRDKGRPAQMQDVTRIVWTDDMYTYW